MAEFMRHLQKTQKNRVDNKFVLESRKLETQVHYIRKLPWQLDQGLGRGVAIPGGVQKRVTADKLKQNSKQTDTSGLGTNSKLTLESPSVETARKPEAGQIKIEGDGRQTEMSMSNDPSRDFLESV